MSPTDRPVAEDIVVAAERIIADTDPEGRPPKCGIQSVHIGPLTWQAVPDAVGTAPTAMNLAGIGEIKSVFTAPADWLLAGRIGIDSSFHLGPIRLLEAVGDGIAEWSTGLGSSTTSTQQLTRALAIRGIATGVSGGTACLWCRAPRQPHDRPSNGAAHRPIGLHGAQVGAASVVAACASQLLTCATG